MLELLKIFIVFLVVCFVYAFAAFLTNWLWTGKTKIEYIFLKEKE